MKLPITLKIVHTPNSGIQHRLVDQDDRFIDQVPVGDLDLYTEMVNCYNSTPRWHKNSDTLWLLIEDGEEIARIRDLGADREFRYKVVINGTQDSDNMCVFRRTLNKAQDTAIMLIKQNEDL